MVFKRVIDGIEVKLRIDDYQAPQNTTLEMYGVTVGIHSDLETPSGISFFIAFEIVISINNVIARPLYSRKRGDLSHHKKE